MSFDKILVATLTIVLAVTTVVVGAFGVIYIPAVQSLGQDVGEIQGRMATIDKRLDRFEGRFDRIDTRFDAVDKKLDLIQKTTQKIQTDMMAVRARLTDAETNPADILRLAGLIVSDWYFAARVDDTIYVFPRNKQAERQLVAGGLLATKIRPYLTGFKVEEIRSR